MPHAIMDISKLINILSQHGKHVTELMNEIGFTGENTLQANLVKGIVTVFNPELTVIYDI